MKKRCIAIIMIIALFVSSVALSATSSDIVFQGIAWLSDEAAFSQGLMSAGFISSGHISGASVSAVDGSFLSTDDNQNVRWVFDNKYKEACTGLMINRMIEKRIAGYAVDNLVVSFANNGRERQLIAVKINLHNGEYNDIKTKITTVYGQSVHTTSEEGIWTDVWYGANESCIMLSTESEGLNYNLVYGRLDAETILDECLNTMNAEVDPTDVSGL